MTQEVNATKKKGKQIDIWSLPANPSIPSRKQPGTTQSGKNPPGLLQLICFQARVKDWASVKKDQLNQNHTTAIEIDEKCPTFSLFTK